MHNTYNTMCTYMCNSVGVFFLAETVLIGSIQTAVCPTINAKPDVFPMSAKVNAF
jgi:hypothetical protein